MALNYSKDAIRFLAFNQILNGITPSKDTGTDTIENLLEEDNSKLINSLNSLSNRDLKDDLISVGYYTDARIFYQYFKTDFYPAMCLAENSNLCYAVMLPPSLKSGEISFEQATLIASDMLPNIQSVYKLPTSESHPDIHIEIVDDIIYTTLTGDDLQKAFHTGLKWYLKGHPQFNLSKLNKHIYPFILVDSDCLMSASQFKKSISAITSFGYNPKVISAMLTNVPNLTPLFQRYGIIAQWKALYNQSIGVLLPNEVNSEDYVEYQEVELPTILLKLSNGSLV